MESQMSVIEWIEENKNMWNLICGVDGEPALEELEKIYRCLCDKVIKNEDFSVLLLTLLTRYGKILFPDELGTAEEIAFSKYLKAVK